MIQMTVGKKDGTCVGIVGEGDLANIMAMCWNVWHNDAMEATNPSLIEVFNQNV